MDTYLPYVGFVQFPQRPEDLTVAVCPACFEPRASGRCSRCGLDLANPAIAELDKASTDATAALDRRLELIGRIRYESTVAAAAATPAASPTADAVSVPLPPPPAAVAPLAPAPTTVAAPAAPAAPAEPRRHLGVQVILLIVGVSLLAVGAIFFLVYAFITFGLVWRSVIIAAVTVASFVGASLLRRRRLFATAEAIAALAVVFVYLDAFAIRANDLFDAARSDALIYWGVALLVSAVGFAVWHRLSALRLPSVVAFISFAPALALLVGGLTNALDDDVRIFAAMLVLAVGALAHPLARGRAIERTISLILGAVGLVIAGILAVFLQETYDWAPLLALALVALVAGAHVALLLRLGTDRFFAIGFACLGAVAAASAFAAVALRVDEPAFTASVPLIAAAAVALVLELVARRTSSPVAIGAAWSAAAVAGIALVAVAGGLLVRALIVASAGIARWSSPGGLPLPLQPTDGPALGALVAVLVLTAAAWTLSGVLRSRRLILVSAALGVLVLAAPLTGQLWLAVLAWLVLAAAAVALLIVGGRRTWGAGIRIALVATGVVSLALSYSSSWASIDTWWYGSVGAVLLLVVARAATGVAPVRAALLAVASVLALVAIGSEGWHTNERFQGGGGAGVDSLHAVLFLAILLVALAALLSRVLSSAETRVLAWLGLGTALVAAGISWAIGAIGFPDALVLPEFATSVVLGVLFLGSLLLWVLRRGDFAPERIATSVALAPVAAWLLDSVARITVLPPFAASLAPIAAALLVAGVSLAAPGVRWARDLGVAVVAVPAVVAAVATRADSTWLVLVLGGAVALLLAVSRDGLFASASGRKHLGWAALTLGFAGLAWSLADRDVRDLEPYVLPLTGALLLVALGAWRAHRTSRAPAFIALGALLVSIVPLGAVSGTGPVERTIVVAAVSAALLLIGTYLRGSVYLDVAAAAGVVGVLVAGFARPVALAIGGATDDAALDIWLAASVAVLLVAAVGQARLSGTARGIVAQSVVVAALVLVVLIEVPVLRDDALGTARALVVVAVLAGIHVAGMLLERAPFTRVVAWIALALAAVVGIAGSVVGAIDPFEWATGIIALALLIVGAVIVDRHPDAGSWPWLAPGLLVLLVPSLLATFVDQPIWRLVCLGLACVAAILLGAVRKLQAPLLIGASVVLVHAIRTFSPQLVAVYQLTEWWVWAVVGGALIIFVAVTFERRVRDLKSVGGRIAALR
ncbi:MAG: hypothetical protein JWR04_2742 [Rhodoglobus sp.]|nr:hypothetical protein [Rhodoglobus sp.]